MGRRQLQQEAEVSIATAVYNAEQLLGAVVSGADHIVVQEHLDLTTIQPLSDISLLNHNRTAVPQFGRSIQVRILHPCAQRIALQEHCLHYYVYL